MSELTLLHESRVAESEIDSLGHMNVRYYLSRAAEANQDLLSKVGFTADENRGQILRHRDTYSRFHREQFAGAALHTLGGLIVGERADGVNGVSAYFEIRNPANDELAATFIITSQLINAADQTVVEPGSTRSADSKYTIQVPPHGAPRSLSLSPPRIVALHDIEAAVSDESTAGMMSGRYEGVVPPEECDPNGWLREDADMMFVVHRAQAEAEGENFGPPLLRDAHGRRYSWAMMEIRSVVLHRPRALETVVAIGADLAYGEKWRQTRRWMFARSTGQLLGVSDTVGICIDLDARRAISIPDEVRETIEQNSYPQFA